MDTVKLVAPAKVNLFLGVGASRPDGYHDALTVMHALAMHDTLSMTRIGAGEHVTLFEPGDAAQPLRQIEVDVAPGSGLDVSARCLWQAGIDPADIPSESNLACRAVRMLAEALGRNEDEAIRIVIEKHIPHQAGLGGGSSDAAAALVGAAKLWGIARDDPALTKVAQELGADVVFFLHGRCAVLSGRGDEFVRALPVRREAVVVVKPEGGVSTARAYAMFDECSQPVGDDLIAAVGQAQTAGDVPLFNSLATPAEALHSGLVAARDFMQQAEGVMQVLLCGSGSGTFAVCRDYASAQSLAASAQRAGYWARATSFSPLSAAALPEGK